MSYFIEAKAKIEKDISEAEKIGRYTPLTVKPTANALIGFCDQSEEFSEAVVDGDSFLDCIRSCDKSTNHAISDYDYFTKAVRFYAPDAEIEVTMTIKLGNKGGNNIIQLNLLDNL